MKKMSKWLLLPVMVLVMFSFVACGKQKVSLEDYVRVSLEGFDGYATASEKIDTDGLDALVEAEKVQKYIGGLSNDMLTAEIAKTVEFSDLLSFSIEGETEGLSNGDKLVIVVEASWMLEQYGQTMESMQEALGISIENTKVEVTVEGLEEAKVIDIMSFVEDYIVYEGANGGAGATIQFTEDVLYECDGFTVTKTPKGMLDAGNRLDIVYNNERVKQVKVVCSYEGHLSEGQEYTIKAESLVKGDDLTLGDTGYIVSESQKVKVPDLGDYVASKDDLSDELKRIFDEKISKHASVDGAKVTYYWGTLKSSAICNNLAAEEHKLFAVVEYESWIFGTEYVLYETNYMIINPDGTYDISVFAGHSKLTREDVLNDDYDLEELDW